MAVSLVKTMAKPFHPEEFRDEYQEALKKVVDAKLAGKKIVAPSAPRVEVGDLMAALRASIQESKKEPALDSCNQQLIARCSGMAADLEEYGRKRNFPQTPEPLPRPGQNRGPLTFVVQKHRARQLHYDFRLELDGVLKSWSVPKGPSLDPETKHLAVMVEDHPLDYASFEGAIPRGEYGAGEVIVWDAGSYSPDEGGQLLFEDRVAAEEQLRQGLKKGKISFTLRGSKLKGSWTLFKLKNTEKDWLLMKHRNEYAAPGRDILLEDRSVLSGRTEECQGKPDGESTSRTCRSAGRSACAIASADGPHARPCCRCPLFRPRLVLRT